MLFIETVKKMLEKVKQIQKNYRKMCKHAIKQITFSNTICS